MLEPNGKAVNVPERFTIVAQVMDVCTDPLFCVGAVNEFNLGLSPAAASAINPGPTYGGDLEVTWFVDY